MAHIGILLPDRFFSRSSPRVGPASNGGHAPLKWEHGNTTMHMTVTTSKETQNAFFLIASVTPILCCGTFGESYKFISPTAPQRRGKFHAENGPVNLGTLRVGLKQQAAPLHSLPSTLAPSPVFL